MWLPEETNRRDEEIRRNEEEARALHEDCMRIEKTHASTRLRVDWQNILQTLISARSTIIQIRKLLWSWYGVRRVEIACLLQ